MTDNALTGSIPEELGASSSLWLLSVEGNKLTGNLPANLKGLRVLWVADNDFTGCVPPELRKVGNNDLGRLSLSDCTGDEATPTATATATDEATYRLTLTQAENGRLVAVPGTGPFTASSNTAVTITATPDHGYELKAWGGDCASTSAMLATCHVAMDADRSATATFGRATPPPVSGPLVLMVISKGDADALTLEWTGGPANASRWQYRTRIYANKEPQAWGSWTNIPGSGATTNSYRLTGLRAHVAYDVQVRAVVGSAAGAASNVGESRTYPMGSIPYIAGRETVEGDGKMAWRIPGGGFTIVIPEGMRLRGSSAGIAEGVPPVVGVKDVTTGSWLWLIDVDGTEWSRKIVTPAQGEGQRVPVDPQRDVGRLFDQIVASVRLDQ